MPKVFISYSHDSSEHRDAIFDLSGRLRAEGVDCDIDQYYPFPEQGWPAWMEQQLDNADFVLVVCTENYLQRFENSQQAGTGQGVKWEALLTRNHMIRWNRCLRRSCMVVRRGCIKQCWMKYTGRD